LTPVVSQVERRRAERDLASLADAVLPAAQHGRDAEATFQRVIKGYSDLFMILKTAVEPGPGSQEADSVGFPTAAHFTLRVRTRFFPIDCRHRSWIQNGRPTAVFRVMEIFWEVLRVTVSNSVRSWRE
jgi:hypothetical protein